MKRRTFLKNIWLGCFAMLVAFVGKGIFSFLEPSKIKKIARKISVGNISDFSVGMVKMFPEQGFFLVRNKKGLMALSRRCTHLGCKIPEFSKETNTFLCPCHGSSFDINGVNIAGPAPKPLDLFAVEIASDGKITVDLSEVVSRNNFDESQIMKV